MGAVDSVSREGNAGCAAHGVRPSWATGDTCEHDEGNGPCGLSTRESEQEHPGFGSPPFKLKHYNGRTRATFTDANPAYWCWEGMKAKDPQALAYFHFEDKDGARIELHDQPRSPGHAYALLAILDRKGG